MFLSAVVAELFTLLTEVKVDNIMQKLLSVMKYHKMQYSLVKVHLVVEIIWSLLDTCALFTYLKQ